MDLSVPMATLYCTSESTSRTAPASVSARSCRLRSTTVDAEKEKKICESDEGPETVKIVQQRHDLGFHRASTSTNGRTTMMLFGPIPLPAKLY